MLNLWKFIVDLWIRIQLKSRDRKEITFAVLEEKKVEHRVILHPLCFCKFCPDIFRMIKHGARNNFPASLRGRTHSQAEKDCSINSQNPSISLRPNIDSEQSSFFEEVSRLLKQPRLR